MVFSSSFYLYLDAYSGYGFTQRMAKIENEFPGANVLFIKGYILPKVINYVESHISLNCNDMLLL